MPRNRRRVNRNRKRKLIPDRFRAVCKYSEQINLTGLPGSYYNFRGNGLYDPDESGTGIQPLGFDQMMALYNQYIVHAARIDLHVANNATTGGAGNVYFTVFPTSADIDSRLGIDQVAMQDNAKSDIIVPVSAGGNPLRLSHYMTTNKMFKSIDKNDQVFTGTALGVPGQEWYFHLEATALDLSATIDIWAQVTITYYCEFFDKKNLTVS